MHLLDPVQVINEKDAFKVLFTYFYGAQHPGGAFVIRSSSGKDATKEFESMGAMGHPESAKARLQKMKIGVVES